ncbi:SDR family oxidoreductase [Sphingomonas sp. ZT3P38]|uniref:SDR family oxidoreductase n=1 Tax=Parasphingomonas zepuensis TaxID=3096161 RepID=UPI002FC80625
MRFDQKIALVIGGNSGIGLAAAQGLAREGATVFLTGRDPATLAAAEREIPGATAFQSDIADLDSLVPVVDAIRQRHGRIDVLMVNAGVGGFATGRDATPEIWDLIHGVNLRGAFFAVQKALPLMGKGGSIVLTGSIGGVLGLPGNVVYAAAKAGLRAVGRNLATELVAEGIRVNVVSPGPTETPIINRNPGMNAGAVSAMRAMMIDAVPMKRMGEADEVAKAMLFLASDEASFITGIDLFVDGGCVEL